MRWRGSGDVGGALEATYRKRADRVDGELISLGERHDGQM